MFEWHSPYPALSIEHQMDALLCLQAARKYISLISINVIWAFLEIFSRKVAITCYSAIAGYLLDLSSTRWTACYVSIDSGLAWIAKSEKMEIGDFLRFGASWRGPWQVRIVAVLRCFRRAQYGRAAMSGSRDLGLTKVVFSRRHRKN